MAPSTRAWHAPRCSRTSTRCSSCGTRPCLNPLLDLRELALFLPYFALQLLYLLLDLRDIRVAEPAVQLPPRLFGNLVIARADAVELLLLELFEVEQHVVAALREADQLVELHLDRFRVAVLRVLDEEHHQERDDGRAGVDD